MKNLGFVATTAPFKTYKKWEKSFNKYLASASYIIVLADNKDDLNYKKYLDCTLKTVQDDYENAARIDLADYQDFFKVDFSSIRTLTDLAEKVSREKLVEFFSYIEEKLSSNEVI